MRGTVTWQCQELVLLSLLWVINWFCGTVLKFWYISPIWDIAFCQKKIIIGIQTNIDCIWHHNNMDISSFSIASIKNSLEEVRAQVYPRNETERKVIFISFYCLVYFFSFLFSIFHCLLLTNVMFNFKKKKKL